MLLLEDSIDVSTIWLETLDSITTPPLDPVGMASVFVAGDDMPEEDESAAAETSDE